MLAFSGRFFITCLDQKGFLSTFFYVFSSTDQYEVRQSKKHQYVNLYQNWNRTKVYLELAVSASYVIGHLRAPSLSANILLKVTLYGRAPEQGRMVLGRWQPPKWCHVCYLLSPLACPASLSQDWLYPHLCLISFFVISSSLPSCKVISCIYQSCCMESYNIQCMYHT